jgi:crossover junction endodeoxyribonuclease RuvC
LKQIYDRLCKIIDQYHPDEFAIETAFYGKNAQSALKLGHARGVSILAAVNFQIPTTEYSPREVKKAVTGNGAASKQQVQFMVKAQLKLREVPKFFDASDALAIALCHSFKITGGKSTSQRTQSQKQKSHRTWSAFVHTHPECIVRAK